MIINLYTQLDTQKGVGSISNTHPTLVKTC
jgi:hypothetical protein